MSLTVWNALLFALKWVLIGLVYIILYRVLATVRREMSQRVASGAPAPERKKATLKVTRTSDGSPVRLGMVYALRSKSQMGSDPDNDIVLPDRFVSRHHATIRWDGEGWQIEDLGSTNGTLLNGLRLPARQPQPLPAGALIQIGGITLQLES